MDPGILITLAIACGLILYAYLKKKIDLSALVGSGVVGIVALISVGFYWLFIILAFFIAGNLVTKYRYSEKKRQGIEQKIRTIKNVLGNGLSAIIFAVLYALTQNPLFLFGYLGAMATASADTFATEIGQVHGKPLLITSLKKVPVGTNGGVSLPGLFAAAIGSAIISIIPLIFENNPSFFFIGTLSGFIGCNIDSVLGATIERKIFDKHAINFSATFGGGIVAIGLFLMMYP